MTTTTEAAAQPDAEYDARRSAGPRPGADESQLSPRRVRIGRILGPVLALGTYLLLGMDTSLAPDARAAAAVVVLMAVWWMTEALPLAATALIPIVAFPLLGVLPTAEATAPYASPTVFLFMGGFMIAIAMEKCNLHKRIALRALSLFGTKPRQVVLGVMVVTAFLSMWVSNTATTLMMLPIGISVLALVTTGNDSDAKDVRNFSVCLMLAIAYAATIGGLSTLIGSPPNLIMAGFAEQTYGITITFADWMKIGVPLSVVFLILAWVLLTRVIYPTKLGRIAGGKQVIHDELAALGPMSRAEWNVLCVFASAALLWVFRDQLTESATITSALPFLTDLTDASIAIGAAVLLFLLPAQRDAGGRRQATLDWRTVQAGLPWGVLLLFGGGLSVAAAVQKTELSEYLGSKVGGLGLLPTVLLIAAVCLIVLLLTELTSNTATAATFLPVLGGVAIGLGIDPMLLLVPAAMAATCSFMLPVGTPPNAIVFGSGRVTMGDMVRAGIWLNLIGVVLITVATVGLGAWALGISF
ncbi:SLC13 family permease [Nocardioides limicola]|uniref:SLC13 family permease n=1 Tax=Nocardioides limicola TaxID=2803368 RepID=UPI00193B082B|nr:DASS family sodium-coupled anion symporter [Nocardioides sp. DJM-14]